MGFHCGLKQPDPIRTRCESARSIEQRAMRNCMQRLGHRRCTIDDDLRIR